MGKIKLLATRNSGEPNHKYRVWLQGATDAVTRHCTTTEIIENNKVIASIHHSVDSWGSVNITPENTRFVRDGIKSNYGPLVGINNFPERFKSREYYGLSDGRVIVRIDRSNRTTGYKQVRYYIGSVIQLNKPTRKEAKEALRVARLRALVVNSSLGNWTYTIRPNCTKSMDFTLCNPYRGTVPLNLSELENLPPEQMISFLDKKLAAQPAWMKPSLSTASN